jgi:hypothetical protein
MIHAAAWFCAEHCGVWTPDGKGALRQRAPVLAATEDVAALLGTPVKFFSRMTAEAQRGVCAGGLALRGALWPKGSREIGVLAAGYEGFLLANREYFADYVASGRKLGRASLFVYTLPTSAASAVSMTLELTGPVLHVQEEGNVWEALARRAAQMAANGEADGMLALWSDPRAAVCLAVGAAEGIGYPAIFQALRASSPWQLAQDLHALPAS